jgi:hypothetical protein
MNDNPIIPDLPEDIPAEDDSIPLGGDDTGTPIVVRSTESKLPEVSGDSTEETDEEDEPSEDLQPRLERLGGEPAPDITPEEFARLQQSGQIHIDPRGRVRSTARSSEADAGVSLRKRRAWYR